MLIKDPYLTSDIKNRSLSAYQRQNIQQFNTNPHPYQNDQKQNIPYTLNQPSTKAYLSQPYYPKPIKISQYPNTQIDKKAQNYQKQLKSLSNAYKNQELMLNKITNYQSINQEYNQAMKKRNYQLNAKLNDLTYEKSLLSKRHEEQLMRNTYDKDLILKMYEEQNQQILRLKRTISQLIDHKARLQSQVDHLMFTIQKENHQGSLQIKQQLIRMQNMQRTLRNMNDVKEQQIMQLRHRLKIYEDQNKRLNDLNKTLTITRQDNIRLDNLSKIQNLDSGIKDIQIFQKNKEKDQKMVDNKKDEFLISQLKQQKQVNQKLMDQINMMKKKLFQDQNKMQNHINHQQSDQQQEFYHQTMRKNNKNLNNQIINQINKINQLRIKVSNKFYDIYCQVEKQAQKQKKNSLLIFIEKYKKLTSQNNKQLQDNIHQYVDLRQNLKNHLKNIPESQSISIKITQTIPSKLKSRTHSKEGQGILSMIQLTKNKRNSALNQKQSHSKQASLNNNLLYLFRLLTILHRSKYPTTQNNQAQQVQTDVNNQLLHSIVKAIQSVFEN